MNLVAIALLVQLTVGLPQRSTLPNPAAENAVPRHIQKDYNKVWERFLKGNEDKKVLSETDSLLKKETEFVPALMIQFYVFQYAGRTLEAEQRLEEILQLQPLHRFALNALADAAYARNDFVRASKLYKSLLTVERSRPDLETRRQKSLLLAVEGLLVGGREAANAGNLDAAERSYREALGLAPDEASLHGELGSILMRQERWEEALAEFQRQIKIGGSNQKAEEGLALVLKRLGRDAGTPSSSDRPGDHPSYAGTADLEALGRWGPEIGRFRQLASSSALTRGEFSWLLCRYFPQLIELPQARHILTDVQNTGVDAEIHAIAGLGLLDPMPNHTFRPSRTLIRREYVQAMARLSRLLKAFPPATRSETAPGEASTTGIRQDVELVISLGLLASGDPANADLSAPVRGEEAVNAAEKLLSFSSEKQP